LRGFARPLLDEAGARKAVFWWGFARPLLDEAGARKAGMNIWPFLFILNIGQYTKNIQSLMPHWRERFFREGFGARSLRGFYTRTAEASGCLETAEADLFGRVSPARLWTLAAAGKADLWRF